MHLYDERINFYWYFTFFLYSIFNSKVNLPKSLVNQQRVQSFHPDITPERLCISQILLRIITFLYRLQTPALCQLIHHPSFLDDPYHMSGSNPLSCSLFIFPPSILLVILVPCEHLFLSPAQC